MEYICTFVTPEDPFFENML